MNVPVLRLQIVGDEDPYVPLEPSEILQGNSRGWIWGQIMFAAPLSRTCCGREHP